MSNPPPAGRAADRNLLFGALALRAGFLDAARFAEACSARAERTDTWLADLLVARGWLTPEDRAAVDKLVERKALELGDDATAGLTEAGGDRPRPATTEGTGPGDDAGIATAVRPPEPAAPAEAAGAPEPGGRYRLIRVHAAGGIGRVWLARDTSLGRDVALKDLRPDRSGGPFLVARFLREARVTGQLEHPGIVPIYELGRRPDDGQPFYAMRFVRGRTLAEAASDYHASRAAGAGGPGKLRVLLTAFVGVCNAVAYAHSRGVLHRDLKPHNVILGDYGEVIVLDWGLARVAGRPEADDHPGEPGGAADGGETVEGQVMGTPAYMAPEQAEGRLDRLGPATDVYGLGAILYEILTGQAPFAASDTTTVLARVVRARPPRPRSVAAGTPPALEAVCLKALAKEPAGRYASAKELAAEVQHWLADEPVAAYREPLSARAWRWARRHRTPVTGAAAAAAAALAGLAVVLLVQARSNRELRAANVRERERLDLAMDAIRTFHTGVSEDVLLRQEGLKGLRGKLLGGAADFYRKLEGSLAGQSDPQSRAALGRAYDQLARVTGAVGSRQEALALHEQALAVQEGLAGEADAGAGARADAGASLVAIGKLLSDTGKPAEALAAFERARGLYRDLLRAAPGDARLRRGLANSHSAAGVLKSRTGRLAEALAEYEAARTIYQELSDQRPPSDGDREMLARAVADVGAAQFQTQQPAEALASNRRAMAIYRELADAHPANDAYRQGLARTTSAVGNVCSHGGSWSEALELFDKARALYQQTADANPAVADYQETVARTCINIGFLQARSGKTAEALATYARARDVYRKLADANPSVADYRFYEADSHCDSAELLAKQGRLEESAASYRQALAIVEAIAAANPSVADYRYRLARSYRGLSTVQRRAGRPAEAVAGLRRAIAILESLQGQTSSEAERVYNLACYQCLLAAAAADPGSGLSAAAARAAADDAMRNVRRAVAGGIRSPDVFRSDTDLDPLRGRDDFKQLLRELEAGAKPGGK